MYNTLKMYTVKPHLSGHIFGNQSLIVYIEIDSLIRIFSYPDSHDQLRNGGVRISDGLYTYCTTF